MRTDIWRCPVPARAQGLRAAGSHLEELPLVEAIEAVFALALGAEQEVDGKSVV